MGRYHLKYARKQFYDWFVPYNEWGSQLAAQCFPALVWVLTLTPIFLSNRFFDWVGREAIAFLMGVFYLGWFLYGIYALPRLISFIYYYHGLKLPLPLNQVIKRGWLTWLLAVFLTQPPFHGMMGFLCFGMVAVAGSLGLRKYFSLPQLLIP